MANDQLSDQLNNIGNVVKDNLDTMSNNIGNFANTAADAILDAAPAATFPTPTIECNSSGRAQLLKLAATIMHQLLTQSLIVEYRRRGVKHA